MEQGIIFSFQETEQQTLSYIRQCAEIKSLFAHTAILKSSCAAYDTEYASLALPFDRAMHAEVDALVKHMQKLKPTVLVIIGIGGSALGAKAVHQAIRGRFHHATNPKLRVYFVETIDSDRIATILS